VSELPIDLDAGPYQRVSVDDCWHGWSLEGGFSAPLSEEKAARAYAHWQLAADLNMPGADDVHRGTVIQKLWNAVDVRVRTLHEAYSLSHLRPILASGKKSTTLDVLEHLGLVRPLILRKIKDIRNTVEHQDKGVPGHSDCENLVDTVWYFLRSTDSLAMERQTTFDLSSGVPTGRSEDSRQFISFTMGEASWNVHARGWFWPHEMAEVGSEATAGLIIDLDQEPRSGRDGALYVSGTIDPRSTLMTSVIRRYFALGLPRGATHHG
jgi:hypothetical protein